MKKTALDRVPVPLPLELERFVTDAPVYDSSCSPEARVFFIDKDSGYYLKCAKAGTLAREAPLSWRIASNKATANENFLFVRCDRV